MELQRMIARFVAEPAPFTQQALYLARRSILDTMGAMIAGSETAAVRQALAESELKPGEYAFYAITGSGPALKAEPL